MTGGPQSRDGGRVDVANEMDDECCWNTNVGEVVDVRHPK